MYNLPQEIEVWYVIPAIRRELAKILVVKHKMTQESVAKILGVSEAAISQYLSKKRADKFKIPERIKTEIGESAKMIIKDKRVAVREILRILSVIKKSKCSCIVCRKYNKGILPLCNMKPINTGELK